MSSVAVIQGKGTIGQPQMPARAQRCFASFKASALLIRPQNQRGKGFGAQEAARPPAITAVLCPH
eukprot:1064392-Pelagomonas_calceolata.AAC.2